MPQLNDSGVIIRITVMSNGTPVDISTATLKQINLRKPFDVLVQKTANFVTNGTDGKIFITTGANDLDTIGTYFVQARITTPAYDMRTEYAPLPVLKNI